MIRPSTLEELEAVALQVAQGHADGMQALGRLLQLAENLPPDRAELLSRPAYERASLWTLGATFQDVDPTGDAEPVVQVIRVQHDVWVRGINAQLYLQFEDEQAAAAFDVDASANLRGLFELTFRVNDRQGFQSEGSGGETFITAALVTGDGQFSCPLDWKLQKDDTIEIRIRSLMGDYVAPDADPAPEFELIPAVFVSFWAEELEQPSTVRR